jgi:hypothetical protein
MSEVCCQTISGSKIDVNSIIRLILGGGNAWRQNLCEWGSVETNKRREAAGRGLLGRFPYKYCIGEVLEEA